MPPSKVELYAAIRRDARAGMSGRAIEKKYRVGQAAPRRRPRPTQTPWPRRSLARMATPPPGTIPLVPQTYTP
jgi:hypothetical protein